MRSYEAAREYFYSMLQKKKTSKAHYIQRVVSTLLGERVETTSVYIQTVLESKAKKKDYI